ncbi:MAG: hypothetical protein FWF57_04225 [Defluviitaleaceae bacterium]|nr:hypothetical protein [Defluviitaleaceae bacterium]
MLEKKYKPILDELDRENKSKGLYIEKVEPLAIIELSIYNYLMGRKAS